MRGVATLRGGLKARGDASLLGGTLGSAGTCQERLMHSTLRFSSKTAVFGTHAAAPARLLVRQCCVATRTAGWPRTGWRSAGRGCPASPRGAADRWWCRTPRRCGAGPLPARRAPRSGTGQRPHASCTPWPAQCPSQALLAHEPPRHAGQPQEHAALQAGRTTPMMAPYLLGARPRPHATPPTEGLDDVTNG